ncbi:MAG: hypothetical protein H6791_00315 [Candidatus Nomurabacteria bacterium]|nr:MAG: hypothetical protein H6791_00315 [Candidatus Nomurabacteria bacterium]
MSIKKFIMKNALRAKGVSKEDAENFASKIEGNPELIASMKKLEENKEVKALFEKIQKEIEEKKKTMPEMYATVQVMGKYKQEVMKHRDELMPLFEMMNK